MKKFFHKQRTKKKFLIFLIKISNHFDSIPEAFSFSAFILSQQANLHSSMLPFFSPLSSHSHKLSHMCVCVCMSTQKCNVDISVYRTISFKQSLSYFRMEKEEEEEEVDYFLLGWNFMNWFWVFLVNDFHLLQFSLSFDGWMISEKKSIVLSGEVGGLQVNKLTTWPKMKSLFFILTFLLNLKLLLLIISISTIQNVKLHNKNKYTNRIMRWKKVLYIGCSSDNISLSLSHFLLPPLRQRHWVLMTVITISYR